ncbi:HNH/ENDO VII family nuclease [Selenomonas ruminantium]|uniref:HNH/ENDO VII family nuclease n=1 Tax=Selenomonas ruminantium TaxID=971 RepID=UPI00210D4E48|nr:HNH/ENDO VII family nuclease [Selenomonas ruminantium]
MAMSGNAPIGKDGKPIELHHVLQKEPGCMVEIESSIHSNNHQVLHGLIEDGDSFRNDPILNKQYKNFKRKYWRWSAENVK